MFSSEPRKSQIVPVLPAASREAGRTVTTADVSATPSQKKSGMISSVNSGTRPAVNSGMRPAVGLNSGMRPAVSGLHNSVANSAAATVMLPRVDFPEKKLELKTVALWLMGGLLLINLGVTTLLLINLDRQNPEEIERRVQIGILQEEVARLKVESEKNFNHASRVYNQLQLDTDMMRGQLQVINQGAVDRQRAEGKSPHDTPSVK